MKSFKRRTSPAAFLTRKLGLLEAISQMGFISGLDNEQERHLGGAALGRPGNNVEVKLELFTLIRVGPAWMIQTEANPTRPSVSPSTNLWAHVSPDTFNDPTAPHPLSRKHPLLKTLIYFKIDFY